MTKNLMQSPTPARQGCTIWFTGLSGSGKTTISQCLAQILEQEGIRFEVLDGDIVRTHLSKGLGFSREDRDINIRRIGWVSKRLTHHGIVVLAAAISPYAEVRNELRNNIGRFIEVFCDAPLETLTQRDPKGLYSRALRGEITQFSGISDPYEAPTNPDLHLLTDRGTPEAYARKIFTQAIELGYIQNNSSKPSTIIQSYQS